MKESASIAVTISRQMGSGGGYLGYLTAKELGFRFVDREILEKAARELGTEVNGLERLDERSSSLIETILKGFSFGAPDSGGVQQARPIYDKDLFTTESKIVNEIARKHDAVFIGRAGFHMLRNHPRIFRVFTFAPKEFRVDRVMKAQKVSRAKAETLVSESDRRRDKFVRDMVGVNWLDVRNYHLCIDTSQIEFEINAKIIGDIVRRKWPQ